MKSKIFLSNIREKLSKENEKIINHGFIKEAEEGKLNIEKIKLFAIQQYYIVNHDMKSLAIMLSRAKDEDEIEFFYSLVSGDREAFIRLKKLIEELKIKELNNIIPEAVSYTHYLSWLANYANAGEQATALIVNIPVWGEACKRLGNALKNNYGIKNIGFFELFSIPSNIEEMAIKVMENYIEKYEKTMEKCAIMIQAYELMFWNGIYR